MLVETDPDAAGMAGMTVARVLGCFAFSYGHDAHECAVVEWFEGEDADRPDPVTGMWTVTPELDEEGNRVVGVIHIDSIVRACHLIGVYGNATIPLDFDFSDSLDAFRRYYVNWYADYHAHEILL